MKNNNGVRKDVIQNEDDLIPSEKWLVAFRNRNIDPYCQKISIREFLSPGFYEAYDRVATFAENTNVEILWFKEKRMCHEPLMNSNHISLEWFCTYCNLESNLQDSIPCNELGCTANLCSRTCYDEHMQLKHRGSVTA
jgi:hypothetical protein